MDKLVFLLKYIRAHTLSYSAGIAFVIATNWIAVTIPEYVQKSIDLLVVGYQVTPDSLARIESELVSRPSFSAEIMQALKSLENQSFEDEERFLEVLRNVLGTDETELFREIIFQHTYLTDTLTKNQELLLRYLFIMLALACAMIVVRTLSRTLFFTPGRAIECEVKNDLFAKLMELQKDYHEQHPSGTVISRLNNDIMGLRMMCGFGLMQVVNICTALSLTPYKMWQLSPALTFYCIIPIIFIFIIVRFGMHFMVINMRQRMQRLQELSAFTVSSLSGIDVIKGFEMHDWSRAEFSGKNRSMRRLSLNLARIRSFFLSLLSNMEHVLKILVLFVGGIFVIEEEFTIGELTAFITYAALLTMPLMALGWVSTMIQQGMVGIESLQTVARQKAPHREIPALPAKEAAHLFDEGLLVRNLHFRYPNQTLDTLRGIDFQILPGQTIGILGRIGSGKTTLVHCLNRYVEAGDDQIFLSGKAINSLAHSDIRRTIRTVTQDPFLFSDTVEENIHFGSIENQDLAPTDLENILYECALEDEVRRFPQQEKTMVGEKGIMLSGGQKQRISLARAMVAPCDLLILDNVLSAVDSETESFLLEQILRKQHARSLLIVSHRAKTMENADWILVLEEGKIVDQGQHQELIDRPGYYRETWLLQNETALA